MKPLPPPDVPGKTDAERFDNAMRKVLSVSKEELLRREAAAESMKRSSKLLVEQSKELANQTRVLLRNQSTKKQPKS